jgi:amino acid transporter
MSGRSDRSPYGRLPKSLGFRDLLLFYIATTFGLRWIATAAASGPSALVIWLIGAAGLFVPLLFATLELSSRYPHEGGIYIWSREAFGSFAGFMTAWTYWCSNLPYFPSLLYFTAGNLLFVGGARWQALSANAAYYLSVSLAGLAVAAWLNVRSLAFAKWLNNAGGIATWVIVAAVIALGGVSWMRYGSATAMPARSFLPAASLKDVVFWSTIAFAFGGIESASSMADEIRDAARTVPRAVIAAAVSMTVLYMVGTLSILVAIPRERVSGLQGIMQAIEAVTTRTHTDVLLPLLAVVLAISSLGGVGAWFAAVARLPFVAGVDRSLPPAFGRLHPTWRTPHVALLSQAAIAALFIVIGQAGTTVRGAYDVLVSMGIISYFIPFLFMFGAFVRVQRVSVTSDVIRTPGGPRVAAGLGILGLATTMASIVFAVIPAGDDPHPGLAVVKIVGLSAAMCAIGVIVYATGAGNRTSTNSAIDKAADRWSD